MPSENCLAFVTGTSSGIGAAVARQLLDTGWTVIGFSRRLPAETHVLYRHVPLDLGDLHGLRTLAEPAIAPIVRERHWSRVGLVNNAAATGSMVPLEEIEPEHFAGLLAVNVVAPVFLMGVVVRATPPDTSVRIVNVSTGAAVQAFPGIGEYGSSKAALRLASMTFVAEMTSSERPGGAREDIAVLSYQPGIVDTPMQVTARAPRPHNRMFVEFHKQGRLVRPGAPAREIVEFLASDPPEPFAERRFGA
jgi:NAD(P)-dependent dehydrogenase (short-subunit alcohol dehydrogenase family)